MRIGRLLLIGLLLLAVVFVPAGVPAAPCSQSLIGPAYSLLTFLIPSAAACPGPDFTLTANPSRFTIIPGATGTASISLSSINSFNGTVSLTTSPLPACPSPGCSTWSINPVSVVLKANGTAASTLTIVDGTSWPGPGNSANITIYGTSGNLTHSAIVTFTTPSSPDFTISANPATQTVQPGATATSTIVLTSINRFSGTISLTTPLVPCSTYCWNLTLMSVNLPAGATANSTLTITTTTSIKPGNYSIPVQASSGSLSHQAIVYFTVPSSPTPDFGMTASPNSLQLTAGSSGTSAITVTSLNGFSGTVSLQTFSPMCPGCTTWSIFPSSVTVSSNVTRTSTLTVLAGSVNPSGTINVTGTSNGLTHNVLVHFTVNTSPNFTISASPGNLTINSGSSGISTINITSVNGFTGTVSLTVQVSPSGPTASLTPSNVTLRTGGTGDSTLIVSTTSSTNLGSYTITVIATSGAISHSIKITLTVLDPPASGGGGGGGGRILRT